MSDRLFAQLAALPSARPSAARASQVRTRCHRALAGRRPHSAERGAAGRVWRPLVAGLSGVYLVEAIRLLFGGTL